MGNDAQRGTSSARGGIESVLVRASLDRRFRRKLLRRRERALAGIELSPAARAALLSASDEQLEAMVDGVARNLIDRRNWLARAATVFGLFLGASALATTTTSCVFTPACTGIRPSESEPESQLLGTGSRPDEPGDVGDDGADKG